MSARVNRALRTLLATPPPADRATWPAAPAPLWDQLHEIVNSLATKPSTREDLASRSRLTEWQVTQAIETLRYHGLILNTPGLAKWQLAEKPPRLP